MTIPPRLQSRKLWVTRLVVAAVAASEILGSPLNDESLAAVTTVVLTWLGAQGLVDTASAFTAGKKVAAAVESVKEVADADEP